MEEIKFAEWEDAPTHTKEEMERFAGEFDEQCHAKRTGDVQERWNLNKSIINGEELTIQGAIIWDDTINNNGV